NLASLRIAGRGFSVECETQNLSDRLIRILRRCNSISIAEREKQKLPVRGKRDCTAGLSTHPAPAVTPDYLKSLQTRLAIGDHQSSARQRNAGSDRRAGF